MQSSHVFKLLEFLGKNKIYNSQYVVGASVALECLGYPVQRSKDSDIDISFEPGVLKRLVEEDVLLESDNQFDVNAKRYQDPTGFIDCVEPNPNAKFYWPFWKNYENSDVNIACGIRHLTRSGVLWFYADLYDAFHMEKHKKTLEMIRTFNHR